MSTVNIKPNVDLVLEKKEELRSLAEELFGTVRDMETVMDPEIAGAEYISICVAARGDVRAIADLRREWLRRTRLLLGENDDLLHLAIDIEE